MVKALGRAALLTAILIAVAFGLWRYTLVTVIILAVAIVFGWLTFMLYMDPPDEWN